MPLYIYSTPYKTSSPKTALAVCPMPITILQVLCVVSGFIPYREPQNYLNAIKVMIGDNLTLCRYSPLLYSYNLTEYLHEYFQPKIGRKI